MHELTVRQGTACTRLSFEGTPILADLLAEHGFPVQRPCGGRGKCGKCAVEVSGCLSQPTAAEVAAGARLACQTTLLGDAQVTLPEAPEHARIELSGEASFRPLAPVSGCLGLAVDIGTTTLAARLLELSTGKTLGQAAMLNPQTTVAADVMGRIGAALEAFGLYSPIIEFAGAGASVPISGFGCALVKGAVKSAKEEGFYGALKGGLSACATGISVAIVSGYAVSVLFKPHTKKK